VKIQDLCRKYNIRFKKQLGQNLLLDDNINRIMVEAASLTGEDHVVEVGAGLGALTERLSSQAGKVLAVEIDRTFMPCLEDRFEDVENVRLFRGDILNHDIAKLVDEYLPGGASYKMVSNLPYYITTAVLFHFWESSVFFSRMVVMVQEEVASRLNPAIGTRDYGVLSLAAQYYAEVDVVHKVPRTCFRPMPDVDSCIVRFRMRETPLFPDVGRDFLFQVIRTAFSQRRKTLRNALTQAFGASRDVLLKAMEAAEIDSNRRPQTVSLTEYARLAREIKARQ